MTSPTQTSADKVWKALHDFLHLEAAGGLCLMATAVIAMLVANSPLAAYYAKLLDLPVEIRIGTFYIAKPLLLWVNDGQMAVFFFLVGMELKREVIEGHLSSLRQASLPAFAALGGMLGPAVLYSAFNWSDPVAMKGWAIPTATDIAFAMGVLSLLGNRVPPALKAFLLSIAIFDDLGAIVVIALFYTAKLSVAALLVAAILILVLALLNRLGVTKPAPYILVGIFLWVAVLKSGVHATLAGVVLGMFIPLRISQDDPSQARESLLHGLEHALHPWVAFGVLPIFAFVNAGVSLAGLSITDLFHALPLGIITGLFLGKLIGVLATCWIAMRLGIAALSAGIQVWQLVGVALLCGIGFTMSLFVASLSFEQGGSAYSGLERLGILTGSLISGGCGYCVLRLKLSPRTEGA
jgi:Na+:H+ antiporter, NhaA family